MSGALQSLRLAAALALWATVLPTTGVSADVPESKTTAPFRVLVFSKTLGYRHSSITNGITALRELGAQNGFTTDATEDSGVFTEQNLARYAAVVFLSATGDVLNPGQESALRSYVLGGGGFMAIHGAVFGPLACEDQWTWYGEMFCCAFTNHSRVVAATVRLEDEAHASNAGLPSAWTRTDEWYNFTGTPRGCAHILATVDESTYTGGTMGGDHPIAWCRPVGRGRLWYTAMGHTESGFEEPLFRKHLLGGILVAAGKIPVELSPDHQPTNPLVWSRTAGALALTQNGATIWRFNYGTNTSKPFFHPVALPGGPTLTWDQPPDHPWHHALWFAWKYIDHVNYWETEAQDSEAKGITEWSEPTLGARPDFSARIAMDLAYHPPGGAPVLTEHRVIEVSPPDPQGTYHLDWTLTFTALGKDVLLERTPLPGEPGGQPWGGYAGLSVRFASDIKDAFALTPQGAVIFTGGTYRGKAAAMDYAGVFGGREAGLAIVAAAGNLNRPSPWYAIDNSTMHYFSPAVIQDAPHLIKAHESFTLRYRVIAHPGRWSAAALQAAVDNFNSDKPTTTNTGTR
jgi:type 1 glutamine amidotransferase